MQHGARMGVAHRLGSIEHQPQHLSLGQLVRGDVVVNGLALDQLHDQERPPGLVLATVQQARDVGMLQPRQHVALVQELPRIDTAADHLDRRLGLVATIVADGAIDLAHAANAEAADHPPGTEPLAHAVVCHGRIAQLLVQARREINGTIRHHIGAVGAQHLQQAIAHHRLQRGAGERSFPFRFRQFAQALEGRTKSRPLFLVHVGMFMSARSRRQNHVGTSSSAAIKARAERRSRFTVGSDTPTTSAISASDSPAKKRSSTTCSSRASISPRR